MECERESIFVSALRTFCRMFFGICGIFIGILVIAYLYSALSSSSSIDQKTNVQYLPDAAGKLEVVASSAPVILQINIHGVIGDAKGLGVDTDSVQNVLLDSRKGTFATDRVKAILLHMSTPGGTVVDSNNIYEMLMRYKEQYHVPVFAYVDGLCASGGMYICCAADQIYSGPSGIIGSVGVVFGPFFNVFDALNKVGITSRTITQGLDKDMMSPFRPWKADEDASIRAVMVSSYARFVDLVVSARPKMDKEKLINEYGAKIFDPVTAELYGYIDVADSSRDAALLALMQRANIDPSKPYQVVELQAKSELLALLSSQSPLFTGKIEHSIDTGVPQLRDQAAYLYLPNY